MNDNELNQYIQNSKDPELQALFAEIEETINNYNAASNRVKLLAWEVKKLPGESMTNKEFYDPLQHSPQENQQYLIELIEEMRSLLIEMQHGEEDYLRSSKAARAMLLASISEAANLIKPISEPSTEIIVDYGFRPEQLNDDY